MPSSDPLKEARLLPNGAAFFRCALQVNPHHYAARFRGQQPSGDSEAYTKAVIEKAIELGISVLAITDHSDVSTVPLFQRLAAGTDLHVFPGFELVSSEGVHVLCIYPEGTPSDQLVRFLGNFGITSTNPSAELSKCTFTEILANVREQRGIAIAAHASSEKGGLLRVLSGMARINAWKSPDLLAIQIPGPVTDLPPELRQIVENKDPNHRRVHAPGGDLAVAVINARDVKDPDDLADPSATCWIKMSEIGIEGFRQAFLDPDSRIRLHGDLPTEQHCELVALAWQGGFLDGAAVHFNPNLNVLVGGRGTGKSTVIESVRAVLGLEPVGDEARKAHDGIVRHVLRSGTKISLLARTSRPALREYRIERTIPNPPIVRDESGNVSNLSPTEALPDIEVYGQHEISELTKSREKLTRLLARFVAQDESLPRRKSEVRRELERNRRSLLDSRTEIRQIEERLAALPGLEETLKTFREAGLEERLKERSLLVREERVLASIPERVAPFRDSLSRLKQAIPIDRAFVSSKALEDLPARDMLSRTNEVISSIEREVAKAITALEHALAAGDSGTAEIRAEWEQRRQKVQLEYEAILRDLQRSRVDAEEFIRLRKQIEELRPLRERMGLVQRAERELAERRRALLSEWEDLKAEDFRGLASAAKKVSRMLGGRVQVSVTSAGDRSPLFKLLRDDIGGRLTEATDALSKVPDLSLTQFVEACRAGAATLAKTYSITPSAAERIAKAEPDVLMRLEELDLPPTTAIQLNVGAVGLPAQWQSLEELSTGQKATAVLLLLLLESEAPLLVDQPEDDLDNRFITEGVVPKMRAEKQRRQFLLSTHNANIPVLGDAELIVGLTASGEAEGGHAQIAPEHMGSIDSQPVRELVEEILEGGREAFETRRRKYHF